MIAAIRDAIITFLASMYALKISLQIISTNKILLIHSREIITANIRMKASSE